MNVEAGPVEGVERAKRPGPQPAWIDWLPEDPSQIILADDESLQENPDDQYLFTLIRPATRTKRRSVADDEIETIETRKIYQQDILDAETWLDDAHRYIDDHEGERKHAIVKSIRAVNTQLKDATAKVGPVLVLVRKRPKPQSEILA